MKSKNRFKNKKIFITGASRGIGKSIAKSFIFEGAWVVGTRTKNINKKDEVCSEWITADFSDHNQINKCADFIKNYKPDILINNAGINKNAPFDKIDHETFKLIQQVNVFTPFILCQAVINSMRKNGWGRIVNISSIWGKICMEGRASYSASKFALDGITSTLAIEYASNGIIANSVAPGFIDTDLTKRMLGLEGIKNLIAKVPAGRLGKVEEIANLVLWLASEENTFITGQNIAIDGGFTRV